MTNEEMQKTMQFIVEQQARNAEQIARNSEQIAQHSEQLAQQSAQIAKHSEQIAEISSQMGQVKDYLQRTLRILEEQGRQTDDRINALISMVERYLSRN